MIGLHVETNLPELLRFLGHVRTDQVPFALSQALNRTAVKARDEQRQALGSRFTLRSRGLVRGFQVNPSSKRQGIARMRAEVGTRDAFWLLQETGGIKRPRAGGHLAIPTKALRRTKTGKIPKARRPRALGPKAHAIESAAFGKALALQKTTRRDRRRVLYFRRKQARIKPALGLRSTVERVARERLALEFRSSYEAAILTARKRARRR